MGLKGGIVSTTIHFKVVTMFLAHPVSPKKEGRQQKDKEKGWEYKIKNNQTAIENLEKCLIEITEKTKIK